MRSQSFITNRPYPLVMEADGAGLGVDTKSPRRPRLTAQWTTGDDGKLTCQWIVA